MPSHAFEEAGDVFDAKLAKRLYDHNLFGRRQPRRRPSLHRLPRETAGDAGAAGGTGAGGGRHVVVSVSASSPSPHGRGGEGTGRRARLAAGETRVRYTAPPALVCRTQPMFQRSRDATESVLEKTLFASAGCWPRSTWGSPSASASC